MNTFKEYLEAVGAKKISENDIKKFGLKNTKIKGGDEVVNESNDFGLRSKISDVLKKWERSDEEEFDGIHEFHFEEVTEDLLKVFHTWLKDNQE